MAVELIDTFRLREPWVMRRHNNFTHMNAVKITMPLKYVYIRQLNAMDHHSCWCASEKQTTTHKYILFPPIHQVTNWKYRFQVQKQIERFLFT